ncbi:MAG: glutamate--cysteine ligase [Mariprofundaceae bacterium]|nr:glutamate--cysteine ligase [Mariprofundaceae bacterium]
MQQSLSLQQLSDTFRQGCKPRHSWRIGTEHEKFGFHIDSLKPLSFAGPSGIAQVLQGLMQFGWQATYEDSQPIALTRQGASVTLEPGGQLELSGAPLLTIHDTYTETSKHFEELAIINDALNIDFLCMGFQPKWVREDIAWMPKARYAVMRNYMPKVGNKGLDMMLRTSTIQANLDFESESDMVRKLRIGFCLQPLVTALYAASPFEHGKPSPYLSNRGAAWLDTDADRTGIPACVFEDGFGFDAWTEWVLDVPMYFVMRDGKYIDCAGESFRAFLDGKLPQLPNQYPSMQDWELHTSTVFPDVRLKQYIEMRGAAAGDIDWICALPALWKGLLYDPQAEEDIWKIVQDWQRDELLILRQEAPKTALATTFRNHTTLELCKTMLDISQAGLERINACNAQGENEQIYLAPLQAILLSGKTRADDWLYHYRHDWQQRVDPLFRLK